MTADATGDGRIEGAQKLMRELRMRKGDDELAVLRVAAAAVDRTSDAIVSGRFAGRTERELADDLTSIVGSEGLDPADWGPIVAAGPNSASAHHLPGERKI